MARDLYLDLYLRWQLFHLDYEFFYLDCTGKNESHEQYLHLDCAWGRACTDIFISIAQERIATTWDSFVISIVGEERFVQVFLARMLIEKNHTHAGQFFHVDCRWGTVCTSTFSSTAHEKKLQTRGAIFSARTQVGNGLYKDFHLDCTGENGKQAGQFFHLERMWGTVRTSVFTSIARERMTNTWGSIFISIVRGYLCSR